MKFQALQKADELYSALEGADNILIVTHYHPDGDAIGSSMALLSFLRTVMGKRADILFSSPIPRTLSFITPRHFEDAESFPERVSPAIDGASLIACLDCRGLERTESLCGPLRRSPAKKILIDHHLDPGREDFDLVFSETEVSSTCELLYQILLAFPCVNGIPGRLPLETRESLMTGMTTDTNNFANSVFPGTLEMASGLLETGVDRGRILENIYQNHKEGRLRLLGHLLSEGMRISRDGVATMLIDKQLMERFGVSDEDTEGFVNEPLAIKEVRMSILLKESDGHFRVSVRSKRGVSANMLCRECFHGGGHEQAAGGKVLWPQDIEKKEDILLYVESVTARFMQDNPPSIS